MTALKGSDPFRLVLPREDESFRAMGTEVRIAVTAPDASARLSRARAEVVAYDRRLSRFRSGSELCALNRDPRRVVPASDLLREAVRAALWAARRSDGLVDPCLLDQIEAAGYERSFAASGEVPPPEGPARPARPAPDAPWRRIRVDDHNGTIVRPVRTRLDLGGSGKGHAADRVAALLEGADSWIVDCGGDLRVGGAHEVAVEPAGVRLRLRDAAIATSSILARAWRPAGGGRAHHLLDPSTGLPAWTGLLAATAVGRTTLEAETLAKLALLRGPEGARRVLAPRGGVLVHAGGEVERIP